MMKLNVQLANWNQLAEEMKGRFRGKLRGIPINLLQVLMECLQIMHIFTGRRRRWLPGIVGASCESFGPDRKT